MGSKKEVKGKKTITFKGQRSRNFSLRKINGLKVQASRIFQKCHRLKNGGLETYDVKYGEKRVQDLNKNVPSSYGYNQRLAYWQGIFQDAQLELNSLKSPEPAGDLDVREGGGASPIPVGDDFVLDGGLDLQPEAATNCEEESLQDSVMCQDAPVADNFQGG